MDYKCVYRTSRGVSRLAPQQVAYFLILTGFLGSAVDATGAENSSLLAHGCVANQGQADSSFNHICQSGGSRLLAAERGFVLDAGAGILRGEFLDSTGTGGPTAGNPLGTQANFLSGADPQKWHIGVPLYGRLAQDELYRGAGLHYDSTSDGLQIGFDLAPGTDLATIRIRYTGAKDLRVDGNGGLLATMPNGTVRQASPRFTQRGGGRIFSGVGRFRLASQDIITLDAGPYDSTLPLSISFAVSSDDATSSSTAVDGAGNTYSVANTPAYQGAFSAAGESAIAGDPVHNIAVSKWLPGAKLAYLTFIGGSADDQANGIAVNDAGNVYVTGMSASRDFPAALLLAGVLSGAHHAYAFKLDPAGSSLVYSAHWGGSRADGGSKIVLDPNGEAYVAGTTLSSDFPVTAGAVNAGGDGGAATFVTHLNGAGTGMLYSSVVRGGRATIEGFAVNPQGEAGVTIAALDGARAALSLRVNGAGTAAQAATTAPAAAATRVHAGGAAYTDPFGQVWAADNSFSGGSNTSTTVPIHGTAMSPLYQTGRDSAQFQYTFTVPNGSYGVTLKFAENNFTQAGQRVFNVKANGQAVLSNFDIVAQAGGRYVAIDKRISATVTNGTLLIDFVPVASSPLVSGIEIVAAPATAAMGAAPSAATLTASQTQQFTAMAGTTAVQSNWTVTPAVGTISSTGLYTAPASVTAAQNVIVSAVSTSDATNVATALVRLIPSATVRV